MSRRIERIDFTDFKIRSLKPAQKLDEDGKPLLDGEGKCTSAHHPWSVSSELRLVWANEGRRVYVIDRSSKTPAARSTINRKNVGLAPIAVIDAMSAAISVSG